MRDIELINYLATDTLHDKVIEAIAITRISEVVATYERTCGYWDSSSESLKRIRLTFHEAEMTGHLDIGFEIYNTSIQTIGDCLRLDLIECSSGLENVFLCAKADIRDCTENSLPTL